MPITWKDDGFFLHVEAKDQVTGDMYWRRAGPGDLKMILSETIAAEREACASKAREFAAHYLQGSDGRNTFVLLAEWIENRARGA